MYISQIEDSPFFSGVTNSSLKPALASFVKSKLSQTDPFQFNSVDSSTSSAHDCDFGALCIPSSHSCITLNPIVVLVLVCFIDTFATTFEFFTISSILVTPDLLPEPLFPVQPVVSFASKSVGHFVVRAFSEGIRVLLPMDIITNLNFF